MRVAVGAFSMLHSKNMATALEDAGGWGGICRDRTGTSRVHGGTARHGVERRVWCPAHGGYPWGNERRYSSTRGGAPHHAGRRKAGLGRYFA
jgi:hypothetical protein